MKKTFTILLFFLFMFSPLAMNPIHIAQTNAAPGDSGNGNAGWTEGLGIIRSEPGLPGTDFKVVLKNALSWLSAILATVFMLVAVAAGLTMMFSVGSQDTFDKARKWLTYAIVGLIIALLAYTIINTIGARLGLGA